MSSKVIAAINTQTGKLVLYSDDVGLFLEWHNGEEGVEGLITFDEIRSFWHQCVRAEPVIRAAEGGKVVSDG